VTQLAGKATLARWVALATPALLLAGAYIGEYAFNLYPCEMCWWQRYAHFAALALAVLAFALPRQPWPIALAALAILASALIGGYHAGVEYNWWEGFTSCTSEIAFMPGGDPLDAIMDAPRVRCDEVQWSLLGVSLAGFNFLISGIAAASIFVLLAAKPRRPVA
jgi:disulfide bond formation protein DsbB